MKINGVKTVAFTPFQKPVGQYNRARALMVRGDQTLYFAAETQGTGDADNIAGELLRPIERIELEFGKRHFRNFEEVQFRRVATLGELVR